MSPGQTRCRLHSGARQELRQQKESWAAAAARLCRSEMRVMQGFARAGDTGAGKEGAVNWYGREQRWKEETGNIPREPKVQ